MSQHFVRSILTLTFLIPSILLIATTISPFKNLGELSGFSDNVVLAKSLSRYAVETEFGTRYRYLLEVKEVLKGADLTADDLIEINRKEFTIDSFSFAVEGDIELESSEQYLFFLNKKSDDTYDPICLSYYIFQEQIFQDSAYLVPTTDHHSYALHPLNDYEPLRVYEKGQLFQKLRGAIHAGATWNESSIDKNLDAERYFHRHHSRSAPDPCTYLSSGGQSFRWNVPEGGTISVHAATNSTPGCVDFYNITQGATADMKGAYADLPISMGSQFAPFATCAGGTALGSAYRNWIDQNLGSRFHVVIQDSDPCDDIQDLSNCGGVLAIGGLYGIGSHTHDGVTWTSGAYGYVILNNDVGCSCNQSNVQDILTHEISHAFGLGHISSSYGHANLNPSCCQAITSLDQECVSYSYADASLLPLETITVSASYENGRNVVRWETVGEYDLEGFEVQKSIDAKHFESITHVPATNELGLNKYVEYDLTLSYSDDLFYRIKINELDGSYRYSNIVSAYRPTGDEVHMVPTSASSVQLYLPEEQSNAQYAVIGLEGKILSRGKINSQTQTIDLRSFPSGMYAVQVRYQGVQKSWKVINHPQ